MAEAARRGVNVNGQLNLLVGGQRFSLLADTRSPGGWTADVQVKQTRQLSEPAS